MPEPLLLSQRSISWWIGVYAEGWFPMSDQLEDAADDPSDAGADLLSGSAPAQPPPAVNGPRGDPQLSHGQHPGDRIANPPSPRQRRHTPLQLYRSRERALLPLDGSLHCPRSLRRVLNRGCFQLSLNRAFDPVLQACAARPETWISQELAGLYRRLHAAGYAHSVEVWQEDALAAGLLAIGIGRCWIAESMAHRLPHAGNVLLVELVAALRRGGFSLFDVQLSTPHLERFGCFCIPDPAYTARLRQARSRGALLQLGQDSLRTLAWPPGCENDR